MSKFFPASVRHTKAREFLQLKQGNMTVLEYVAKFTELARFKDDYMATNMAKVRKFKDGLKLSIRGKIVGFLIQDMDSMVTTAMAKEREIEARGRRVRLLLVWERSRRLPVHEGFKDKAAAIKAKARPGLLAGPRLLASLSRSHVIITISLDM